MRPVTIIGGGFSGLATAFYLSRLGIPSKVLERSDRLGGLISTKETPHGPVENAANGVLNSRRCEELFHDLDLPMCFPKPTAKARYIFRGKPRRWPLGVGESLETVGRVLGTLVTRRGLGASEQESLGEWGRRVIGRPATDYLLAPALQGIYGVGPQSLSASLILPKLSRADRPRKRGIVAPPRGMEDLIQRLRQVLSSRGVEFQFGTAAQLDSTKECTVVCTSADDAARVLQFVAPETGALLSQVKLLPLLKVTMFIEDDEAPNGFGVLFPAREGFNSLGVLFNTCIFDNRGALRSETWIMEGGEPGNSVLDLRDEEIIDRLLHDRARIVGKQASPEATYVKRWPHALPQYNLALESMLGRPFSLPHNVFLVGNYLGGIGLSKILPKAEEVALEIAQNGGRVG